MTTEATAAERLAWLESEIRKLTTRQQRLDEQLSGRSLKSDFAKLAAVREERLTVATELEALQEERVDVAAVVAEQAREAQRRENEIASTELEDALLRDPWRIYRLTVEDLARRWYRNQFSRAELGVPDLGDVHISLKHIADLLVEQDQRAAASIRQAMGHDRQPDAAIEGWQQHQDLVSQLHVTGEPWSKAERLADLVASGTMTREAALSGATEEETQDEESTLAESEV